MIQLLTKRRKLKRKILTISRKYQPLLQNWLIPTFTQTTQHQWIPQGLSIMMFLDRTKTTFQLTTSQLRCINKNKKPQKNTIQSRMSLKKKKRGKPRIHFQTITLTPKLKLKDVITNIFWVTQQNYRSIMLLKGMTVRAAMDSKESTAKAAKKREKRRSIKEESTVQAAKKREKRRSIQEESTVQAAKKREKRRSIKIKSTVEMTQTEEPSKIREDSAMFQESDNSI